MGGGWVMGVLVLLSGVDVEAGHPIYSISRIVMSKIL